MHQIIYIENDEEVNSVISKIKKTSEKQVVLAVPQRALILQSAVNLKMIRKITDKLKKKIMIVSRDKNGLSLARKIGFFTKESLDGLGKANGKIIPVKRSTTLSKEPVLKKKIAKINDETKDRLKKLGSDNFFEDKKEKSIQQTAPSLQKKHPQQQKAIHLSEKDLAFQDLFVNNENGNNSIRQTTSNSQPKKTKKNISPKVQRIFWLFGISTIGIIICTILYLFLPTATIKVYPKKDTIDFTVGAVVSDADNWESKFADTIFLKLSLIENENSLTISQESSGETSATNQKASGKITIYNKFSEANQILVATTRFLSEDGKLFRLVKGVTVPGMSGDKAGEIEVSVIADKAGEDYNVNPTTFSIPGFKGSNKYEKFYAKSSTKMKGGGSGNKAFKSITAEDIEKAKKETELKIKENALAKIQETIGENKILLDNAVKNEILDQSHFPEVDTLADKLEYQIKMKTIGLVFSKDEVENKIVDYLNKNILDEQSADNLNLASLEKEFVITSADFSKQQLNIDVHAKAHYISKIDTEKLISALLGKDYSEIEKVINNFSDIDKIEATLSPNFLTKKMPRYKNRIKIEVIK